MVLLGVGVGIGEPPVAAIYHNKFAPGTKPPAVNGDIDVPSQNIWFVVVGAPGRSFTVIVIGLLALSQPLVVIWLA